MHFPPNFTWQVFDLPLIVTQGKSIAAACGEARLQFTSQWQDASGADLLLASGALHYFDVPFDKMIAEFAPKPSYILINRTPLIDGPTKATVQLSTGPKTPCVLYNSAQLISGVEAIGYELVDSWKAPERSLKIVGKPEYSADAYSGLFFRVKRLA